MQFNFEEMELTEGREFGGKLTITANGAAEVLALIDHFQLFQDTSNIESLQARIAAMQSETLSHVIYSEKRPVYEIDSALDYEFTKPYCDWALRCFGYDGQFPNLEIPRRWKGLIHTNYQARLYTSNQHICFLTYVQSQPWNNMDANTYAERCAHDLIGEEFGTRYREPEFKQTRNGQYVKNPDYLKRHIPKPAATNSRLKVAFFDWWLENVANDAQKTIVAGNKAIAANVSYMECFKFERFESHIYYEKTAKDYKIMSFDQFAKLGV